MLKREIFPVGSIIRYLMLKVFKKAKVGHHIPFLPLRNILNQIFYTEQLPTLSISSSNNSSSPLNQILYTEQLPTLSNYRNPFKNTNISLANQSLLRNLLSLLILLRVVDLSSLHQAIIHAILMSHIIMVATSYRYLHP